MKTFIAVLLLSTSSLAMAGGFRSVPNPYEQRPSPSYGNTGGLQSVPNPYEQRPTYNERERAEHYDEHERYHHEQKTQGYQAQRYRR